MKKFGAYGQGWWEDEHGPHGRLGRLGGSGAGPLHALNPVRVRYIAEAVTGAGGGKSEKGQGQGKGVLSGYRILDVGCGGGLLSEALARCVWMCV